MLELERIQALAQSYSPQELLAALIWQRQFNDFDGFLCPFSNYSNMQVG